jgi:hypothetical protein
MPAHKTPSPASPENAQYSNYKRWSWIVGGSTLAIVVRFALSAFHGSGVFGILLAFPGAMLLIGGICVVIQDPQ